MRVCETAEPVSRKGIAKEAFLKVVLPQRHSAAVLLSTLAGVSRIVFCMVQQIHTLQQSKALVCSRTFAECGLGLSKPRGKAD